MFRLQSIDQVQSKIKALLHYIDKNEVYMAVSMVLVAIGAYLLGKIEVIGENRPPVRVEWCAIQNSRPAAAISPKTIIQTTDTPDTRAEKPIPKYVASKTGKKYHLPNCVGAKSIAEDRKIWFATKAEAEKAGYTPAQNCKDI